MLPSIPLLPLALLSSLSLSSASPSPAPDHATHSTHSTRAQSGEPVAIPLHHITSRQYSDDVEIRRSWLSDQATTLRSKYANQLSEGEMELHRRDSLEAPSRRRQLEAYLSRRDLDGDGDGDGNDEGSDSGNTNDRRDGNRQSRRATASVTLANIGVDASYAAAVSIGTPAQSFLVILDTGSSDLWVTGEACTTATCRATTPFFEDDSTSYQSNGERFSITYGSGSAAGVVAQDTVSMGGFTVNGQGLAVVNTTSANLITAPISGLMGLAFRQLAQTASTPFWQTLATSGSWDQQEMGFYMRRYRGTRGVQAVERNGGEFVMGFTGNMNYISIPTTSMDFWRIPLQGMTVGGNNVEVNTPQAAIDTGTTLIGVPSTVIRGIYDQIPGAQAMSSQSGYAGYYQFPCNSTVNVTLQFGGLSYAISNADFNLGAFNTRDTSMCTGAFFEMNLNARSPIQWIVGATFMKNVYTSFRYQPPAIGFAGLAESSGGGSSITQGNSPNGTNSPSPSGSAGGGNPGNGAGAGARAGVGMVGLVGLVGGVVVMMVVLGVGI